VSAELDLEAEWKYRYTERLGIMCGDKEPTQEQKNIAIKEANEAVAKLREEDESE
jgi:hypothetical protein